MSEYFKGDQDEKNYHEVGREFITNLGFDRETFFDEAYSCQRLGEILHESKRVPLANAIPIEVFKESFKSIFGSFLEAGSFYGYLNVFADIFGPTVDVTFTVPAPGKLEIDIVADSVAEYLFATNEIEGDIFTSNNIVDQEDDNIIFRLVKGFKSQYEVEQMLFEMVPAGIFTEITLTLGE